MGVLQVLVFTGHQRQVLMGLICQATHLASALCVPAKEPFMACKAGQRCDQILRFRDPMCCCMEDRLDVVIIQVRDSRV